MNADDNYIIYLPDTKDNDPDYMESSDLSETCDENPIPSLTSDEDIDDE